MPEPKLAARLVLTTAANPEEAAQIGRALVAEHLAACIQLIPGTQSIYHWKGGIEESLETLLLIKTGPDKLEELQQRLNELHSYEIPEFLVIEVDSASPRYLDWLYASLQPT
jgi:periplasmic divalent cation tolerance protein